MTTDIYADTTSDVINQILIFRTRTKIIARALRLAPCALRLAFQLNPWDPAMIQRLSGGRP
jgi:hypothetical protein